MVYQIAVDSCTDLTPAMKADEHIHLVPLTLHVGEDTIIDDASFDQADFLAKVAACPQAPSSACPSPQDFMDAFGHNEDPAFGITLSAELSGSYNSALLGQQILQDEIPGKKIHVFNSRSACCGQSLILLKIQECIHAGLSFEETVAAVDQFISEETTLFVLESLDALHKNGRLTGLKAALVTVLNIKPVMSSTPAGYVEQVSMGRGMKKALLKMIEHVGATAINPSEKIFAITHCNCPKRAQWLKEQIEKEYTFKDVIIIDAAGVASLYASDGGIVVAY